MSSFHTSPRGPRGHTTLRRAAALAGVSAVLVVAAAAPSAHAATITGEATATTYAGTPWNTSGNDRRPYAGNAQPLFDGGTISVAADGPTDGGQIERHFFATLQAPPAPCEEATASVAVSVSATNLGPNAGYQNDGRILLANSPQPGEGQPFAVVNSQNTPVGGTTTLATAAQVDPASLADGSVAVSFYLESRHQNGEKAWSVHSFSATYTYDTSVCDPAVLVDDAASTVEDTPVTIDVTGNDTIPDGSTGFAVDTTSAQGGAVVDHGDGTVTYTPPSGFVGTDTFTYRVTGPDGVEVSATVTVTVTEDDEPAIPMVAGGLAGVGLLGAAGLGLGRLRARASRD